MERASSWGARAVSSLILAYVMLRPVSSGEILYPLLGVLAVAPLAALVVGRRRAAPEVVGVIFAALLAGIYGTTVGAYNSGISQHAIVWLIGPLVFGLWALSADLRMVRALMTAAAWATIALSLLIVAYVVSQIGGPSLVPRWLIEEAGAGFNIEGGATAIRLYGLSTLTAAAPMWIVGAFVSNHELLPRRWVRVAAAGAATAAALLGGRNAIVLVVVLVPLLFVLGRSIVRHLPRKTIPPGAVIGFLAIVVAVPFVMPAVISNPAVHRTWENVSSFFRSSDEQAVRTEQADRLLTAWQQSPFLGRGLGATIEGYARSQARPWNFELQYHLILFQFGIIGSLIVLAAFVLGVRAVLKAGKARPDLVPVLLVSSAAALGMIVANATNPYLQAPGHMWAIWLPLLVANASLCSLPAKTRPGVRAHHERVDA